MSTTLKKIDNTCSSIQLIDSSLCLGDSLPVINKNIASLKSNLEDLGLHLGEWNNVLTSFFPISSIMLQTMYNIQTINNTVPSPYEVVQSLSATWSNKQFSLYYPVIQELVTYDKGTVPATIEIKNWLDNNFPPSSFVDGQIVNIFVNLYYTNVFTFKYDAAYSENCSPTLHSDATISCHGAGNDNRTVTGGCNHVWNGHKVCDDPYTYCHVEKTTDTETYSCQGYIRNTYTWTSDSEPYKRSEPHYIGTNGALNIHYTQNGSDRYIARVISYTYRIINSNWVLIS
jgi:hypothetical protein